MTKSIVWFNHLYCSYVLFPYERKEYRDFLHPYLLILQCLPNMIHIFLDMIHLLEMPYLILHHHQTNKEDLKTICWMI